MSDRRLQWTPPPRPDWVQRINEEGYCMDIRSVVPLHPESLIDSAIRSTGLSDFGDDAWKEPFQIVATAFDEEAEFNLMGRLRTRSEVLQLLEARLQIEETYKRYPEIEDEVIERPLFIIGQSRSGTSMLHNVMAQNPDHGVIKHWEAVFPCPPPAAATYLTDPRIEKAHKLVDQWNRVTPTMTSMHEFAGELPMECCVVLGMAFMSPSWFDSLGQVPTYDAYIATRDMTPAMQYHKRVLKLLQWKNPRKQWVLKDPMHLDRIEALLKVYPDALLVWPHRDPTKAMSSVVNLLGTVQWGRSDHPFKGGSFEYIVDPHGAAARLNGFIDKIETGIVPRKQIFNLSYEDLTSDTIGVLRQMYQYFGLEFSDVGQQAIAAYLGTHPRSSRPEHKVAKANEEAVALDRKLFKRYCDYFDVRLE